MSIISITKGNPLVSRFPLLKEPINEMPRVS